MAASPEHPSQQALSDYLDEQLAPVEHARVQAHLAGCATCSASYVQLEATIRLLRQLPPMSPPRDFRIGPRVARPNFATRLYPWTRALTGIAAALVVVLFTLDMAVLGPGGPADSSQPANVGRAATQPLPTAAQPAVVAQAPAAAPTTAAAKPTSVPSPAAPTAAKSAPSPTVAVAAASEAAPPPAAAVAAAPAAPEAAADSGAGQAAETESADAASGGASQAAEAEAAPAEPTQPEPTQAETVVVVAAGTPSPLPTLTPTTPPVEPTVAPPVVTSARPAESRATLWPWTLVALALAVRLGVATLVLRRQAQLSRT